MSQPGKKPFCRALTRPFCIFRGRELKLRSLTENKTNDKMNRASLEEKGKRFLPKNLFTSCLVRPSFACKCVIFRLKQTFKMFYT